jgi:hypothetical protein
MRGGARVRGDAYGQEVIKVPPSMARDLLLGGQRKAPPQYQLWQCFSPSFPNANGATPGVAGTQPEHS